MVKVQFKDGQTLSFDLTERSDLLAWKHFCKGEGWSESVTAMGILCRKTVHTLPVPNHGLRAYGFGAGLITGKPRHKILGESVWLCINGMKIILQVYNTNQKVTRVTVKPVKGEFRNATSHVPY